MMLVVDEHDLLAGFGIRQTDATRGGVFARDLTHRSTRRQIIADSSKRSVKCSAGKPSMRKLIVVAPQRHDHSDYVEPHREPDVKRPRDRTNVARRTLHVRSAAVVISSSALAGGRSGGPTRIGRMTRL